jgi:Zn-dependent protease
MNYQTTLAPVLAGLGGLWMLASAAMRHRGWGRMPMHGHWEMGHMMWGEAIVEPLGGWWQWIGIFAGAIVLVIAIILSLAPQYRRSLGITIVLMAILNLIFNIDSLFPGLLAIGGGLLAVSYRPSTAKSGGGLPALLKSIPIQET